MSENDQLTNAEWHTSSHSGGGINGHNECVEVAALTDGRIAVRDSKRPGGGVVVIGQAEMAAWVRGIKHSGIDA